VSKNVRKIDIPKSVQLAAAMKLVGKHRGCWPWPGSMREDGYGHIFRNGKHYRAHRAVYQYFKGAIPAWLELDHTCRNKACVNPDHLEPVTHAVNVQRGDDARY
jgi:hypothetical protein